MRYICGFIYIHTHINEACAKENKFFGQGHLHSISVFKMCLPASGDTLHIFKDRNATPAAFVLLNSEIIYVSMLVHFCYMRSWWIRMPHQPFIHICICIRLVELLESNHDVTIYIIIDMI